MPHPTDDSFPPPHPHRTSSPQAQDAYEVLVEEFLADLAGAAKLFRLAGGSDLAAVRRTIKRLPDLLQPNERYGQLAKFRLATGRIVALPGVLAATNDRVIMVSDGLIQGLQVSDFPYDTMTAVEAKTRLRYGILKIHAAGAIANIEQIMPAQSAHRMAAYVREQIRSRRTPGDERPGPDVLDRLKRLGELRDNGVLTSEEFDQHKLALIARLDSEARR